MRLEAKKYLLDIQQAAALASEFVAGRTFADYQRTAMLRAAVERQCEIIGEALAKLAKVDEPVAAQHPVQSLDSWPCATRGDGSFLRRLSGSPMARYSAW